MQHKKDKKDIIYDKARINMIKGQILPSKINDERIINALNYVPRDYFVPEKFRSVSYVDDAIPLGNNRILMPILLLVKIIKAANIQPTDNVLIIGCATGYSAAITARLARNVVAVESDSDLASKANKNINKIGIKNAIVISDKLINGNPDAAPFDIIFINGAVDKIPDQIIAQLTDNGKIITTINTSPYIGEVVIYQKRNNDLTREDLFEAKLKLLPGFGENDE